MNIIIVMIIIMIKIIIIMILLLLIIIIMIIIHMIMIINITYIIIIVIVVIVYEYSWARKPRGTNHGAENTIHLFMMRFTTCFWKSGLNLSPAFGGAIVPQWCRNLPPPGLHPLVRARMK